MVCTKMMTALFYARPCTHSTQQSTQGETQAHNLMGELPWDLNVKRFCNLKAPIALYLALSPLENSLYDLSTVQSRILSPR